jgi:hypothetical protein
MSRLITIDEKLKRLKEDQARLAAREKTLKREINHLSRRNANRAEQLIGQATVAILATGLNVAASEIYEKAKILARPSDTEAMERVAVELKVQANATPVAGPDHAIATEAPSPPEMRQYPEETHADQLAPAAALVAPASSPSPAVSISPRISMPFDRLPPQPREPNYRPTGQNGDHQPSTAKTIE